MEERSLFTVIHYNSRQLQRKKKDIIIMNCSTCNNVFALNGTKIGYWLLGQILWTRLCNLCYDADDKSHRNEKWFQLCIKQIKGYKKNNQMDNSAKVICVIVDCLREFGNFS